MVRSASRQPARSFRQPVATSLAPTPIAWEPAPPALRAQLQAVHAAGQHYTAAGLGGAISYCRISDPARGMDLFLKLVPRQLATSLQKADAIAAWLANCGLAVPVCLPGYPRACSDGRVMFGYPFIAGHYLSAGSQQMYALGSALGELHRALARYPDARAVARRRNAMRSRLRHQAARLLADASWAGGALTVARQQLADWLVIDAGLRQQPRQVIHNDLNIGNVLQDNHGKLWFLDFEEAVWSYLPAHFDIARAIERFILARTEAASPSSAAARQLLQAYAETAGAEPQRTLTDALRWQLGFSWLRLARLLHDPAATEHPEVRKFLRLGEIVEDSAGWLEKL